MCQHPTNEFVGLQLGSASIALRPSASWSATFGSLTDSLPPTRVEKVAMFLEAFRLASSENPHRTQVICLPLQFALATWPHFEQVWEVWYGAMTMTRLPKASALYSTKLRN
jgi:hypothetical protein